MAMGKTSIQWTEMTWNPVRGCTRKSPGCVNCYAEVMAARFSQPGMWGHGFATMKGGDHRWTGKVELIEDMLKVPLGWKKPRRIFVNSTSDLFHEDLPDEAIDRVFAVMALCPQHTFQILTKRPERMREHFENEERAMLISVALGKMLDGDWVWNDGKPWRHQIEQAISFFMGEDVDSEGCIRRFQDEPLPLPNVWLGTSIEDQERADERKPLLQNTPAAVRFLSVEPLIEEVELGDLSGIHQVIVGGESGPGARPFYAAWARKIVRRCRKQGVACFVKQMGSNVRDRNDAGFEGCDDTEWPLTDEFAQLEHNPDGCLDEAQGAPVRIRLKDKKGGDMDEWPADLRVRQFPFPKAAA